MFPGLERFRLRIAEAQRRALPGLFHSCSLPQSSVLLTTVLIATETDAMARYSAFLGRKVEVHYRAGDICLPATGAFVADSGRSIFLEQRFDHMGTRKTFRWEVPYSYIVRIEERPTELADDSQSSPVLLTSEPEPARESSPEIVESKASAAAAGAGGASSALPFTHTRMA